MLPAVRAFPESRLPESRGLKLLRYPYVDLVLVAATESWLVAGVFLGLCREASVGHGQLGFAVSACASIERGKFLGFESLRCDDRVGFAFGRFEFRLERDDLAFLGAGGRFRGLDFAGQRRDASLGFRRCDFPLGVLEFERGNLGVGCGEGFGCGMVGLGFTEESHRAFYKRRQSRCRHSACRGASTGVAMHPEKICEECGLENVCWFAPSKIWNRVCRPNGETTSDPMLCPTCFIKRAEAAGFTGDAWEVAPEFYDPPYRTPVIVKLP